MADIPAAPFEGRALALERSERLLFRGLDFALAPGGALLLTGPNGSGKTSLLRLMAGLLRPTDGTLLWDGVPVGRERAEHGVRVQYLGHADAVKPVLTVAEQVAFWADYGGATDRAGRVAAALDAVAIGHLADMPGRFLSAGQRRRVNLARLLVRPAPLWLLDEPATALDTDTVARLEWIIARQREGGGLVVLSSHAELAVPGAARIALERFAPALPRRAA